MILSINLINCNQLLIVNSCNLVTCRQTGEFVNFPIHPWSANYKRASKWLAFAYIKRNFRGHFNFKIYPKTFWLFRVKFHKGPIKHCNILWIHISVLTKVSSDVVYIHFLKKWVCIEVKNAETLTKQIQKLMLTGIVFVFSYEITFR